MIRDNSDIAWESFGQRDAYFGVVTEERFKDKNLDVNQKIDFFRTGETHVSQVIEALKTQFGSLDMTTMRVMDYGCGVGRLVLPFRRMGAEVTGVDISRSMLEHARKNLEAEGFTDVTFTRPGDDNLSNVKGQFDLIHSVIVLQHIPTKRGHKIIRAMADKIRPGGYLIIDPNLQNNYSPLKRLINSMRQNIAFTQILVNILRGNRWNQPYMQMNEYDANRILLDLMERGFQDIRIKPSIQGRNRQNKGMWIYARRTS